MFVRMTLGMLALVVLGMLPMVAQEAGSKKIVSSVLPDACAQAAPAIGRRLRRPIPPPAPSMPPREQRSRVSRRTGRIRSS